MAMLVYLEGTIQNLSKGSSERCHGICPDANAQKFIHARIVLRLPDATAVIGDVVPNSAIELIR